MAFMRERTIPWGIAYNNQIKKIIDLKMLIMYLETI